MPRFNSPRALSGLLVEAQPAQQQILSSMLAKEFGTKVQVVSDLDSAARELSLRAYDFIILDHQIEGRLSGSDFLEEASRHGWIRPFCTLIILTASRNPEQVIACAEFAPDDYLIKPVTPRILVDRLDAALRRKTPLRLAYEEFERGGVDQSIELFEAALSASPHRSTQRFIRHALARAYLSLKQFDAAESQLAMLNADPGTRLLRIEILHDRGADTRAIEQLRSLLLDQPRFLRAHDLLAQYLSLAGRAQEAMDAREAALSINPHRKQRVVAQAMEALHVGDTEIAEARLAAVAGNGMSLSNSGSHEDLQAAVAYAQLLLERQRFHVAKEQIQSIESHPDILAYPLAKALSAQLSSMLGDTSEALQQLALIQEFASQHPLPALVAGLSGLAAACAGSLALAEEWTDLALLRHSGEPRDFEFLKRSFVSAGQGDLFSDRVKFIAIRRAKELSQADQFKSAGQFAVAADYLHKLALRSDASVSSALRALQALHEAQEQGQGGQSDGLLAERLLRHAIALDPKHPELPLLRQLARNLGAVLD